MKTAFLVVVLVAFAGCMAEELPADDVAETEQALDNSPVGGGGGNCNAQCSSDFDVDMLVCGAQYSACVGSKGKKCELYYNVCNEFAVAYNDQCNNACWLKKIFGPIFIP